MMFLVKGEIFADGSDTDYKGVKRCASQLRTNRIEEIAMKKEIVVKENEPCIYNITFTTYDGKKRNVQWWAKSAGEPATFLGTCDKKAMAFCLQLSYAGLIDVDFSNDYF